MIRLALVLLLCGTEYAKETKKPDPPKEHKYISIFEIDTNNITIELCCPRKIDPKEPWYHLPHPMTF